MLTLRSCPRVVLIESSLEHYVSLEQIKDIFDNFEKWAKPESVELSIYVAARPHIRKEPKGVVLIFVPFNYPIMLLMSPLVRYPRSFHGLCVKRDCVLGWSDCCGKRGLRQGLRTPSSNELTARRTLPKVLGS